MATEILLTVLLRCSSYTTKSTYLKYVIQWFFSIFTDIATITIVNSRTFSSFQQETEYLLAITPLQPSLPSDP